MLGHVGKLGLEEDSSFPIYVSGKSKKVAEITYATLWVVEFLMACSKSSTEAAMKAEPVGGRAGGGTSTELASRASGNCVTLSEEVTGGESGPHLRNPVEFAKKREKKKKGEGEKEKKKGKRATTICQGSAKCSTSERCLFLHIFRELKEQAKRILST